MRGKNVSLADFCSIRDGKIYSQHTKKKQHLVLKRINGKHT